MHDVAPQQMIQPSAIHPFGGNRPWRRQVLGDRRLALLGQQQAAQPAVRIRQRRCHRVMAVKPDRALRRIRRGSGGVIVALALRRCGQALGRPVAWRTWLEFTARRATRWARFAAGTRAVMPRLLVVALNRVTRLGAVAGARFRALPAAALSRWPRRMSARPAVGASIRRRARGAAGTIAMGRFHCKPL